MLLKVILKAYRERKNGGLFSRTASGYLLARQKDVILLQAVLKVERSETVTWHYST